MVEERRGVSYLSFDDEHDDSSISMNPQRFQGDVMSARVCVYATIFSHDCIQMAWPLDWCCYDSIFISYSFEMVAVPRIATRQRAAAAIITL